MFDSCDSIWCGVSVCIDYCQWVCVYRLCDSDTWFSFLSAWVSKWHVLSEYQISKYKYVCVQVCLRVSVPLTGLQVCKCVPVQVWVSVPVCKTRIQFDRLGGVEGGGCACLWRGGVVAYTHTNWSNQWFYSWWSWKLTDVRTHMSFNVNYIHWFTQYSYKLR